MDQNRLILTSPRNKTMQEPPVILDIEEFEKLHEIYHGSNNNKLDFYFS